MEPLTSSAEDAQRRCVCGHLLQTHDHLGYCGVCPCWKMTPMSFLVEALKRGRGTKS